MMIGLNWKIESLKMMIEILKTSWKSRFLLRLKKRKKTVEKKMNRWSWR